MKDTRGPGATSRIAAACPSTASSTAITRLAHGSRASCRVLQRVVPLVHDRPGLTASILCTGHQVVMTRNVAVLHHREWAEREGDEKVVREMGGHRQLRRLSPEVRVPVAVAHMARARARAPRLLHRAHPLLGVDPSARRFWLNRRDWLNLAGGRFMSLLDPLLTIGRPYHLVQSIPCGVLASPDNPYGDAERASRYASRTDDRVDARFMTRATATSWRRSATTIRAASTRRSSCFARRRTAALMPSSLQKRSNRTLYTRANVRVAVRQREQLRVDVRRAPRSARARLGGVPRAAALRGGDRRRVLRDPLRHRERRFSSRSSTCLLTRSRRAISRTFH